MLPDDLLVDAAAASGWHWVATQSSRVRTAEESFPCLVFRASRPHRQATDDVDCLAWWAGTGLDALRERIRSEEHLTLGGAAAILAYRLLPQRESRQERRQSYDDGHIARKEIGVAGDRGYRLTRYDGVD